MDDANGTLKPPRAAPSLNGVAKPQLNGRTAGPGGRAKPRGPGMLARTLSVVARLLTWYSIFTILFRCPATLDACDDSSPRICKPYFQLKRAVAPHVEPYYDAYAAPYVELVRPYYKVVDRTIITPGWTLAKQHGAPRLEQAQHFGKAQWEKHVEPRVGQYRDVVKAQYDQKVAPHINRVSTSFWPYYDIARTNSLQTYHELLLPTYEYIQPHLRDGYRATSAFVGNTVVPGFVWAWNKTYLFLEGTVWPHIRVIYVENVEPQLIKIGKRLGRYSSGKKSVPKPLTDSSTSSSTQTTSSFVKPAVSVTAASSASLSATPSSGAQTENDRSATDSTRLRSPIEPIPPPEVDEKLENEDPVRRAARETVAADLKDWQERYTKAADEGAAEIDDRVHEIAKRMIRRNARTTGKSLLEQLKTTSESELVALRHSILDIIDTANKGSVTPEEAEEQAIKVVRQAGMAIKEKAQDVRTWRENYEAEMQTSITKAAETHFAILENIRDLALQKIGMKWAWMDGVTYKDWAKYHLLKSRFEEWKGDLENLIVTHPSLEAAQVEGANIEDEAMQVAASAAKELARLKQVAKWKLVAGDDTPEFDSTLMQQAAEAAEAAKTAAASAAEEVMTSVSDTEDAMVEGLTDGVSRVSEVVEEVTDPALSSHDNNEEEQVSVSAEEGETPESLFPPAEAASALQGDATSPADPSSSAQDAKPSDTESVSASEELSSIVEPTSEPTDESGVSDSPAEPGVASSVMFETPVMAANATELEQDDSMSPDLAELPVEEGQRVETDENEEHLVEEELHSDRKEAEEPPVEDEQHPEGQETENLPVEVEQYGEGEDTEDLPISDTASVKPAMFGAAAQSVPSRVPILDDEEEDAVASAMESIRSDLKSASSAAMARANEQYSQALSIVSAQLHGTPEPAHEKLLASVTSAYSKAMVSASSRLDDALRAASGQLRGTTTKKHTLPTPVPVPQVPEVDWSRVESVAAERLQQGRTWASEQYESAKIAIGLVTPTPSTPAEHVKKFLDNAKHNYYANLGLAQERYSEFLAAASSAFSSMTATPTPTDLAGSASSIASVAGESVASAASAASEGASSVASAVGENASAVGDKVAAGWEVVLTRISIQVYGAPTPTPWYSSVFDAATEYVSSATAAAGAYAAAGSEQVAQQYVVASSIVSELLVGKEPSFSESVVSRLSAAYATGASAASTFVSAAQETAASAAAAVKEAVVDAKDEL
ncbi:hypothetical protein VTK26DRAFT_893 [Humicola hyalothermophila]